MRRRAALGVVGAGVVLEGGCALIWVLSPGLTAAYNSEYTGEYFARWPFGLSLVHAVVGVLGPLGAEPRTPVDAVARLEAGLLLMCAGYVLGILAVRATGGGAAVLVLGFAAVFRLTMASLPGLFSTDIFSYVMYGRIASVYHQNPYVQAPSDFPSDPFVAWVFPFWRDQPSVYGPLWTDFSWLLSLLTAGWTNFDQVMAYRLSLISLELVTLALVWWLLGRVQRQDAAVSARTMACAMYAWNPLVLFDLVGSTHNDVAMLALLVFGLAVRASTSSVSIALSALVKFASGVVWLLWSVAYAAAGDSRTGRLGRAGRLGRLAASSALAAVLALVLWWPWLQTPRALAPLTDAAGGRLVLNSAPDLVALFVADQLLVTAGFEKQVAEEETRTWIRAMTRVLYAGYLGWELRRLWSRVARDRRILSPAEADLSPAVADLPSAAVDLPPAAVDLSPAVVEAATRALLVLPLLVLTWVWSWYFSWPLVLAPLLGWQSRLARLVVAYSLVTLPIVYAHQYLNEAFSGGFVLLMVLGPLSVLLVRDGRPSR